MTAGQRSRVSLTRVEGFDKKALRKYYGTMLRNRRKALAMSQAMLAQQMGTTKATISAMELGQRSLTECALLCAYLLDVPYVLLFPPQRETSVDRLIRRILAAPPHVHELFNSILDITQYGVRTQQVDVG